MHIYDPTMKAISIIYYYVCSCMLLIGVYHDTVFHQELNKYCGMDEGCFKVFVQRVLRLYETVSFPLEKRSNTFSGMAPLPVYRAGIESTFHILDVLPFGPFWRIHVISLYKFATGGGNYRG